MAAEERGTGGKVERAVLVGVELTRAEPSLRSHANRAGAAGARLALVRPEDAAEVANSEEILPSSGEAVLGSGPAQALARADTNLDVDESLAEFRELVASAGAVVVAEVMQRRSRPDPATLIG